MQHAAKAARYLRGVERVMCPMRAGTHDEMKVDVRVELDWADGTKRKSTSGGMMMIVGTVVKHWSRKQATGALSAAEAEHYAVITGAPEALRMQSLMTDSGRVHGVVSGWTTMQPRPFHQEEALGRPNMLS